jgi:anti-sigma-K factor RskA
MNLNCEETDALLGEFVIGALSPEEQSAVEEHLADCRNHDAAVAEYRSVVAALALTTEEIRPPRRLRGRLLTAFDNEARAAPALGQPHRFGRRGAWWRPEYVYGIAAVLLVAVIGLLAWNLSLRGNSGGPVVKEAQAGTNRLMVVYFPDKQLVVVDFELPQPGPDRTYQAWRVPQGGGPISLGLLGPKGPVAFKTDLAPADTVAVSLEPAGGSPQPTTTPLIAVQQFSRSAIQPFPDEIRPAEMLNC